MAISPVSRVKSFVNDRSKSRIRDLKVQERLLEATEELLTLAKADAAVQKKILWEANRTRQIQENIRMMAMAPVRAELRSAVQNRQLDFIKTLNTIRDEKLSFARFGDGEFRAICRIDFNLRFQKNSPALQRALADVLKNPSQNVLIGMPNVFADLHWLTTYAEIWHDIQPMVQGAERFGNSHVTRPIAFQVHGREVVDAWREIWSGLNAIVITGKDSRFDMNPALFDCLKSHEFVYSTPTDAFSDVARVLEEVMSLKPEIVLISLGPAGSILANALAKNGVQALDIGHLSASYENILEGGLFPEDRPVSR